MMPCLVNTTNRKPYTKVTSSNDSRDLDIVSSKTPDVPVQIILSASPLEYHLSIDFFEKDYVQNRMTFILEAIWEDGLKQTQFDHATNCINEVKENRPILSLSPEYLVKIHQYQTKFTQHFLKSFLPQISQENMTTLELSLTLSMHGFNYAIAQSFEYKNLLEQGTNNFQNNFRHSKKMVNFAKENFPEAEFMEPIRMERFDALRSPFLKCAEDEIFITETVGKVKKIIDCDEHLAQLFYLLVCFSPAEEGGVEEKNIQIMKEYQEKVSIMIYSYLMKKSNNLKSLEKMTRLVSIVDDVHKIGQIFSTGLVIASEPIELDAITLDSLL